jgi:arginine transport system substrate-binding protein
MLKFFKKYLVAISALAVIVGLTAMKNNDKVSPDALVVGLQSGYPPFEFMDANGNIVGFDIDVANCIAEEMGK